jgi:hypothetical protein
MTRYRQYLDAATFETALLHELGVYICLLVVETDAVGM